MRDIFNLDGKIVVIFGGNGYLGKEFCKALLEFGATVYSCDINDNDSPEILELKKIYQEKYNLIKIDATDKTKLGNLRDEILKNEKT